MAHPDMDRFVVIDTETTGLDPDADRVVSLAAVPVSGGRIQRDAAKEILINPGIPVPAAATAIHGLCDADLADGCTRAEALEQLGPLFTDRVIVGHNVAFDLAFLGLDPPAGSTIDTLAVSRLLWPGPGTGHSLDALAARVGVTPTDRHSALGDAAATAEVLLACLPELHRRSLTTPEEIAAASERDRRRRDQLRRSIRRRSRNRPDHSHRRLRSRHRAGLRKR